MNYAYTSGSPDEWHELGTEGNYRDHCFVYPAHDRHVDTIQWEGWREGVDDVRYMATLLDMMDDAEQAGCCAELLADNRAWIDTLTGYEDCQTTRQAIIERILALQASMSE
jgi:hypothetical protein